MTDVSFPARSARLWGNLPLMIALPGVGVAVSVCAHVLDLSDRMHSLGIGLALLGAAVLVAVYSGRCMHRGMHDVPSPTVYRDESPTSFRIMIAFDWMAVAALALSGAWVLRGVVA